MKMFRERDPMPLGIGAIVIVVLVVTLVLNINTVIAVFGRHYSAVISEAAGLKQGDPVEVSGLKVGRISSVKLGGRGVVVDFSITNGSIKLGDQTTASIEVVTVLGAKALVLKSAGGGTLHGQIPLSRTTSPYDVTDALSQLTTETGKIDVNQVASALNVVSSTLDGATPELRSAITGIGRLSETLGSRDATLEALLAHANTFSQVLADRSGDMTALVKDGNLLFAELLKRRQDISTLLSNVSSMSAQLSALVDQNQGIVGPALAQLHGVVATLQANKSNLDKSLKGLSVYATGLGEVVASGPFFTAYLQNLLPGNLIPPVITLPRASAAGAGR
ncbi:MAG: virulence factor Mce family protein [Marmoricola sp.]|nr:virulence factor Mce family protein [Marmoricola sp.]